MSYNTELQSNNADIRAIIDIANSMPDKENLDAEMTTQDELIEQIQTALEGKAAGGGGTGVEYEVVYYSRMHPNVLPTYSLSRVTHAFGVLYDTDGSFRATAGAIFGINGKNVCYLSSSSTLGGSLMFFTTVKECVYYANGVITFSDGTPPSNMTIVLINDPNAVAISEEV